MYFILLFLNHDNYITLIFLCKVPYYVRYEKYSIFFVTGIYLNQQLSNCSLALRRWRHSVAISFEGSVMSFLATLDANAWQVSVSTLLLTGREPDITYPSLNSVVASYDVRTLCRKWIKYELDTSFHPCKHAIILGRNFLDFTFK